MMIDSVPCQYGQLTRAEFRNGVQRDMCSRPSVTSIVRESAAGTAMIVYLCDEHAPHTEAADMAECFYCRLTITREDPADAWSTYGPELDDPRRYPCPPSPWGEHGVICGDCQGRGLNACVACNGNGATA